MAFTANQTIKNSKNNLSNNEFDFLNQEKSYAKENPTDFLGQEMTQKASQKFNIKLINALKIVSPIILVLMEKAGYNSEKMNKEELSKSFKYLVETTNQLSEFICEKITEIDNSNSLWLKNNFETHLAKIISKEWKYNKDVDIDNIKKLIEATLNTVDIFSEKGDYVPIKGSLNVKVSCIQALNYMQQELYKYNTISRDINNELSDYLNIVFLAAENGTKKISDSYATEDERGQVFSILIQEAAKAYINSWKNYNQYVESTLSSYEEEKKQNLLNKYKSTGGFPLTKVNENFNLFFERILQTTLVVIQEKTNPQKKMKKT